MSFVIEVEDGVWLDPSHPSGITDHVTKYENAKKYYTYEEAKIDLDIAVKYRNFKSIKVVNMHDVQPDEYRYKYGY